MKITELEGMIGAEIHGPDLAEVTDDEYTAIHHALLTYSVIVLREQTFTPQQQVAFTRRFGDVEIRPLGGKPSTPNADGTRLPDEIVQIIYEGGKGLSTDEWHSDASYLSTPPALTMATLRELPGAGGDTMFASQYAAHDGLSDTFKSVVNGLTAVHKDPRSDAPEQRHAVVGHHPETGRPCLYVNPMFTTRIDGFSPAESTAMLAFLFAHQVRPEYVYRHRWQHGDFVIWDNRSVLHYAIKDYGPARRVLHRTTVLGTRP